MIHYILGDTFMQEREEGLLSEERKDPIVP